MRRQVKLIGSRQVFGPPKYGREREVPLAGSVKDWSGRVPGAVAGSGHHVAVAGPRRGKPTTVSLMATTRERTVINRSYFNSAIWKPALRKAGVPATRANGTHALRHFYASALLDGGENIRAVSEYLGHADPGFTCGSYTHLMPSSAERTRSARSTPYSAPSRAPAISQICHRKALEARGAGRR